MKQLEPIKSLSQLQKNASMGPLSHRYTRLAKIAAHNLGYSGSDLRSAMNALNMMADETDSEEGVVAEVNFCLDIEAKEADSAS